MTINISLPDGKVINAKKGTNALEIAKSISEGLARNILTLFFFENLMGFFSRPDFY